MVVHAAHLKLPVMQHCYPLEALSYGAMELVVGILEFSTKHH